MHANDRSIRVLEGGYHWFTSQDSALSPHSSVRWSQPYTQTWDEGHFRAAIPLGNLKSQSRHLK